MTYSLLVKIHITSFSCILQIYVTQALANESLELTDDSETSEDEVNVMLIITCLIFFFTLFAEFYKQLARVYLKKGLQDRIQLKIMNTDN